MGRKPGTSLEPVAEAQRQITFAETMHKRLTEKNRRAEQMYLDKINTLKATHAELQKAEAA